MQPSVLFEPLERRTFLTVAGGGFAETVAGTGLRAPTAMVVGPNRNPDAYIAEKAGRIRLFRNGALNNNPLAILDVDATGDRGLLGITISRTFEIDRSLYVCYVTQGPTPHLRVSKFLTSGDVLLTDFETTLLDLPAWDPQTNGTGLVNLGGAIHFGFDGTLYVGIGDSGRKENAPDLDSPFGKILRIKPDGTVPADNPYAGDTGWKKYVWAYGLHDPAKFAIHPDVGIVYLNDPGTTKFDEVNRGTPGTNYGWYFDEGPGPNGATPIYSAAYQPTDPDELPAGHITGGAFFSPGTLTFPVPFGGDYFFADRGAGAIRVMDLNKYQPGEVDVFATGLNSPIDLGSTPDGDLLCLTLGGANGGEIIRFSPTGGAAIVKQPRGGTAVEGSTFSVSVSATASTPLTYQWQRNGVDIPGATSATYTTGSLALADDGATFSVVVTGGGASVVSRSVAVHVTPASSGGGTGGTGGGGTGGTGGGGTGGTGGGGTGGTGGGGQTPGNPIPGPSDLVPQFVSSLPATAVGGARAKASIRLFNLGLGDVRGSVTLRLYLSTDPVLDSSDATVIDVVKNLKLKPGTSKVIKAKFAYPSDRPDDLYQLLAVADPANAMVETNETNNLAASGGMMELAAPYVDVRPTVGQTSAVVKVGGKTSVPVALFNAGNSPSAAADVTVVISLAPGASLAGATGAAAAEAVALASPVYSRTVRLSLPPGRSKTLKLKFALPAEIAVGEYTFVASVDTTNVIAEVNETNNTAVAPGPLQIG